MAEILMRVEWYKDKGTAPVEVLSDIVSVNYTKGTEAKANTCEITLINPLNKVTSDGKKIHKYIYNSGNIKFQEEDVIKVFLRQTNTTGTIDTSITSPDLVFVGEVSEIGTEVSKSKTMIKLSCVDKTFILLNKLWSYNYTSSTLPTCRAPNIVQDIIRATTGNTTSTIRYDSNGVGLSTAWGGGYDIDARFTSVSGGFIEDTRPGGSNFPSITLSLKAKPVYDWLLQLSQIENTNTSTEINGGTNPIKRSMRFYVDELNRFHWFYPKDGVLTYLDGAINSSSTAAITVDDASSFPSSGTIYIDAEQIEYVGTSSTQLGTTSVTRGVNNTTGAAHSDNAVITSSLDIIEGNKDSGINVYGAKLTKKTFDILNFVIFNAGDDLNNDSILYYHYDSSSAFSKDKMTFKGYTDIAKLLKSNEAAIGNITLNEDGTVTINVASGTTSWNEAYTDATDYNNKFISKAIKKGKDRATVLIGNTGNIRWKGTITVRGRRFTPGTLIRYTSDSIGLQKQFLRIIKIQNNINKSGWSSTLTVEEDQGETSVI